MPYGDPLRQAIAAAEARKPDAHFRLAAVAPDQGDADAQNKALDGIATLARQVLDDMGQDGISPERVTLSSATAPNLPGREIRLYQD